MNGRIKWIYTKRRNIFQELIRASGNLKGSDRKGAARSAGEEGEISTAASDSLSKVETLGALFQRQMCATRINWMLRRTRSSEGITGNRYYPLLPPPPKRDPSTALSDRRNFVSANLVRASHLPFISFPGDRVSSSTIVAKSDNRQMINLARPRIHIAVQLWNNITT